MHDINSLGEIESLCLTPLLIAKAGPSCSSCIVEVEDLYTLSSMLMYLGRICRSRRAFATAVILTESNAFSKSIKANESGMLNSVVFSFSWYSVCRWSAVLLFDLKPAWSFDCDILWTHLSFLSRSQWTAYRDVIAILWAYSFSGPLDSLSWVGVLHTRFSIFLVLFLSLCMRWTAVQEASPLHLQLSWVARLLPRPSVRRFTIFEAFYGLLDLIFWNSSIELGSEAWCSHGSTSILLS